MTSWRGLACSRLAFSFIHSTSMNKIIIVSSRDAAHRQISGRKIVFSYNLPETLHFTEPHVVRLLFSVPAPRAGQEVSVQPDFAAPHIVNGTYQPWVGSSAWNQIATWVDLATSQVPATGLITLSLIRGTAIPAASQYTLGFEFIPKRLAIYGTPRSA